MPASYFVEKLCHLRFIGVQLFATIIAVNHREGQTKFDAFYYDLMHSFVGPDVPKPWIPGLAAYPNSVLTSHYDAAPLCILMAHIPIEALQKQLDANIYYLHSIMDFILVMNQVSGEVLRMYLANYLFNIERQC